MATQEMMGTSSETGLLDALGVVRQLDLELRNARRAHLKVGVIHAAVHVPHLRGGTAQVEMEAEVLRVLIQRLTSSLRRTDIVGYLGDHDFIVVLSDVRTAGDACRVADGVLRTLHHPFSISNRVLQVGANAGVAVSGLHGSTSQKLMIEAERAVFEARKRPGKRSFLAPPRLAGRVLGLNRHKAELLPPSDGRHRAGDSRDWTGPRSER